MAKPFLKWAGGKSQLISEIESRLPKDLKKIDTYVEPFIGGGALLFHMLEKYDFKNIHISDINLELVLCYRQIQSSVDDVITSLRTLIGLYPEDEGARSKFFYKIRELWNSNLDIESMTDSEKSERVAQMIFLNKTCFNGLFRVNKSGRFNVPTGRYKKPSFTTPEALKEVSVALQGVTIHHASYEECLNWVDDKSFVYFDPPYRPLSKTSSFNSYSKGDFNDEDQRRLADVFRNLNQRGVSVLLSNSDPTNTVPKDDFFDALYSGFQIDRVNANRAINSVRTGRGPIRELLIYNSDIMDEVQINTINCSSLNMSEMTKIVAELPKDEHIFVFDKGEVRISLFRPSTLPPRMNPDTYDVNRNFQIWLHYTDGRTFKPNHLRVFIDLGLRSKCRPDLKRNLCLAFDSIFYGESVRKAVSPLSNEQFSLELNSIEVIARLAQLFVIEQDFNYLGESKFEPKTLFFQGWIRAFLDSFKEIDNLSMSVARGQPPLVRYTNMENKKHKDFDPERPVLWYLNE